MDEPLVKEKDLIGWVCGGVSLSVSGVEMLVKPILVDGATKEKKKTIEIGRTLPLWVKTREEPCFDL